MNSEFFNVVSGMSTGYSIGYQTVTMSEARNIPYCHPEESTAAAQHKLQNSPVSRGNTAFLLAAKLVNTNHDG